MPLNLENIDLGSFGISEDDVQTDQVKSNLSEAFKVNPDQHSQLTKLSDQSGIPAFAVESDPVQVEQKLKLDQIDFTEMSKRSPNTAKYLTDFNNSVIAQDDIDVLQSIEDIFDFGKTFENIGESITTGFSSQLAGAKAVGVDTTPDRIQDLISPSILPMGMEADALSMSTNLAERFGVTTDEQLQEVKKSAQDKMLTELRELHEKRKTLTPEDLNLLEEGVRAGIESLGNMAPGFGLMLLTGGRAAPLLATIGVQTFGDSYGEARSEGLTPQKSAWFAGIDTAIEVGTEILPMKTLETIITGKSKGLTKSALKFVVQEMGTEQLATLGQSINSYAFGLDEQMENAESISEMVDIQLRRQAVTAIATVVAGGAQITAATGLRKGIEALNKDVSAKENQSDIEQGKIDRLNEQAEKSKLRERNKESFKQFVEQADGENNTHVFIDGVQTSLYLQSKTREEIEADPALKLLSEQAQEASNLGGDIQVPVADFAAEIAGTDHYTQLRDSMTMSDETASPFRQEQVKQEGETYVRNLMDEAQENTSEYVEAQEIYTSVRDQLVDSGQVNAANSSIMAQIVPAWATAQARRSGKTVQQVYQESGLVIEGPQTGERARLEGELLEQEPLTSDQRSERAGDLGLVITDGVLGKQYSTDNARVAVMEDSEFAPRKNSITDFVVDESERGKGVGRKILSDVLSLYDSNDISAAASSESSVTLFYDNGFRPITEPAATLSRSFELMKELSSVTMVVPVEQFSQSQIEKDKNLFVAHNLSVENILSAKELGGLAAPSIAVARADISDFSGFGEVTLLADPNLLNDSKARTFDADVYSPRQPRAVYDVNQDKYNGLYVQLDPDNLGLSKPDIQSIEDTSGADNLLRSTAVEYHWLKLQEKEPKLKKSKVELIIKKADKLNLGEFELIENPKFIKMVSDHYQKQLDNMSGEGFDVRAERMTEWYFNEDGSIKESKLRDIAGEVRRFRNTNGVDVHRLRQDISKKLRTDKIRKEYEQWVTEVFNDMVTGRKLFKGFTPSGNRKYVPYNMQNVVKEMTQELQAGESTFYGAGTVRSKYANEMKTIRQIQSKRDDIVSEEDMTRVKDESADVFSKALNDLKPFYKFESDSWGYSDDAGNAIIEGRKGLNEAFNMTPEAQKIVDDLLEYLVALPTSYFESKIQRAVEFEEFNTAIVPRGMRKDALQVLKDAGLKIKTYDSKVEGSRVEVIAKQKKLFFQKTTDKQPKARGYYDPSNSIIRLNESADLSTFLHEFAHFMYEMEVNGNTEMLQSINSWYKRNADDVAKEANGYLGEKFDTLKQGDASDEARLQRAREQGFDVGTVMYRGMNVEVTAMRVNEQGVVYVTPDSSLASHPHYGGREGGVIYPMYIKDELLFDFRNEYQANLLREHKNITFRSAANGDFRSLQKPKVIEFLKEKGFTGFHALEPHGEPSIALFNSSDMRSVNAQFQDPNSSDLLAQPTTPQATKKGSITSDDITTFLDNRTTGDTNKDSAIRRAVHEQFARGFETYLMEGKAPSIELRNAFRTFARWLSRIYQNLRGQLNVNLDAEMRQVFDRLLATEEQIQAAEVRARVEPMFTDASMAGMTEEEFNDYKTRQEKVKDVQSEILRDKIIKQLTRQTKTWWKEEKQDIIDEEIDSLKKQQVYIARDRLKSVLSSEGIDQSLLELNKEIDTLDKDLRKLTKENNTIGQWVSKSGGLDRNEFEAHGVDKESFKLKSKVFGKPMFPRKGGMTLETLTERLNEEGFNGGGLSNQDALDIVFDVLTDDSSFFNADITGEVGRIDNQLDELMQDRNDLEAQRSSLNIKLDHATVKEMVGETKIDKVNRTSVRIPSKLSGMTAKGQAGIHPDEAAAFFGYNSGSEMINDLINAPDIKMLAKTNAESIMVDRHGDILNDGTIEKEADEAVQSEERGKLILHELKILARNTNSPTVERDAIKALAEENIGKLSFRQIHPGKYRKAEIRAAQEASRMLAEGNREGAAAAKMRQVMNYYLGMAATNAKNETVKIVDRMARYNKKKVREEIQKAEGGYWDQIVKILGRFEFRKAATLKQVESINTWVKERTEVDGDGLVLSNVVLNESVQTHWKNVPFSDLQGVNDSVKNIEHVARYSNKMTTMQEDIDFKKLENQWVGHIKLQDERFPTKESRSRLDDARKATASEHVRRWASQLTKVPFLASWLDGGSRTGLSQNILVDPFTDALDAKMKLVDEVATPVYELIENRSKEDRKRHSTKIWIPEIDDHLMGHQIVAVALNTGNQGNLKKMLLGEGWANPENEAEISIDNPQLQSILAHMSESDAVLVQKIWDQMELLYPQLAEIHRRTTGQTPPKVESSPVTIAGVKLKGGYYPVKYSPARSHKAAKNAEKLEAETESMFNNTASIQASVNTGVTNERTGFYDRINLSLEVIPDHFNETIHYITHHDAVRQVNRMIKSPTVADAISGVLGEEEYKQLKPWLNDIAKDGRQQPTKTFIDEAFQRLRFGTTLGVMGFKASTGIMQIFGILTTSAELGVGPTMKGIYTSVGRAWYMKAVRNLLGSRDDLQTGWEFAAERSKVMNHRTKTMDREIRNAMNRLQGKRGFVAATQEVSMKHIALIQTYMVDLPTWHAAYSKEISESGDEGKAIRRADWSVENLQGSGATKDMATILRNQGKIHTTFTMFMTFFSSLGNLSRDLVKGGKSGLYSPTSVAAKTMFLFTLPVFLEMLMRGELDEPEDEDERLSKFATKVVLYPITSLPFVRDVASGLGSEYGYNSSPVASLLEKGIAGYKQIGERTFTDEEITKGAIKGASKLTGAAFGVPGINQAWATGEHLYDVIENGEEFTARELLFGPDRK